MSTVRAAAISIVVLAALGAAPAAAAPPGQVTVIVTLRDRANLAPFRRLPRGERVRGVAEALRRHADQRQGALRRLLLLRRFEGRVSRVTPLWIANGLAVTATPEVIQELASRADVLSVTPDDVPIVPTALPAGPPTWNVAAVAAPDAWALGATGHGVVVALLDSGVDVSHPDLAARWRGGSNSWFDPYGQHASPYDPSGHGTWTAGLLVGGDASGDTLGVAPEAQLVAARVFDDAGRATATAIHLAFQWALDPDGDPATDDAPQVVNGSWSYGAPGCNLEFQRDLQALVAAGIVPVFAAGNAGPFAGTSVSPANYPEAVSVGAVTATGAIYASSGRGPSACGGATYPTVVAPGAGVTTTDLFGFWTSASGTSVAAPHVAGVLALLAGAWPDATVERLTLALRRSARDLGVAGPDGTFGYGLVTARGAYDDLAAAPPPPPAPPTAAADAYLVGANTSATFTAPGVLGNDVDPDGGPLTAALVTSAAHGELLLQADGGFTYTPVAGFSGADGFSYQASDGLLASAVTSVVITVTAPANQPPVALDDAASTRAGTAVTIQVLANDRDPDGVLVAGSVTVVTMPRSGSATRKADGSVIYTPNRGFRGNDAFSYTVRDAAAALSNLATVRVRVK